VRQQENTAYWNKRAYEIKDEVMITHNDIYQKYLELDFIDQFLKPFMNVLEVGCGNAFVTKHISKSVAHVDGFDPSEIMISKAKQICKEISNVSLYVGALPHPSINELLSHYDAIISVRVIINLENQIFQNKAIEWIASKLKPGGHFLMLEGYEDGIRNLDKFRVAAGLKPISRSPFNVNLKKGWLENIVSSYFHINEYKTLGLYDILTRVFYPVYVGEDKVQYNTHFHESAYKLSKIASLQGQLAEASRLFCYHLTRK